MSKVNTLEATLSDGEVIVTRLPNVTETQAADWEFSKVFNKAIKAGIPPRAGFLKELMDSGAWTQEEEDHTVVLRTALDAKLAELAEARADESVDKEAIAAMQTEVKVAQQALWLHTNKLNAMLAHTAENKADDAKLYYLTYTVTRKKDGTPLWNSIEDFRADTNAERVNTAMFQYMLLQSGLSPEKQEEAKKQLDGEVADSTSEEEVTDVTETE